jgi:hypothetical protein
MNAKIVFQSPQLRDISEYLTKINVTIRNNGKVIYVHRMNAYGGAVVHHHALLTLALDKRELSDSNSSPSTLCKRTQNTN